MTPSKDAFEPATTADFLARVGVDAALGLSRDDAMARRALYGANRVTPPVNCPSWVCCLLPCLLRTPSMRAYQAAMPRDATVRRCQGLKSPPTSTSNSAMTRSSSSSSAITASGSSLSGVGGRGGRPRRLRMDAASLVYGDVVELEAGDVVGADLRVIEASDDCLVDQRVLVGGDLDEDGTQDADGDHVDDIEAQSPHGPRRFKRVRDEVPSAANGPPQRHGENGLLSARNVLLMATELVRGRALGVVIATGDATVWGQMLAAHEWPVATTSGTRRRRQHQGQAQDDETQEALMQDKV